MRLIDADAMITYAEYDVFSDDCIKRPMTIRELLDMVTEEGCPINYYNSHNEWFKEHIEQKGENK